MCELDECRKRADLIQVLKILKNLSLPRIDKLFNTNTGSRNRGHSFKQVKNHWHSDVKKCFLTCHRQMEQITATSLDSIKSRLIKERQSKMDLFLDWCLLGPISIVGVHCTIFLVWQHEIIYQATCFATITDQLSCILCAAFAVSQPHSCFYSCNNELVWKRLVVG